MSAATLEIVAKVLNWGIWIAFALEFVVMLALVPDRKKYLRHHPVEIVVVFLTPPGPAARTPEPAGDPPAAPASPAQARPALEPRLFQSGPPVRRPAHPARSSRRRFRLPRLRSKQPAPFRVGRHLLGLHRHDHPRLRIHRHHPRRPDHRSSDPPGRHLLHSHAHRRHSPALPETRTTGPGTRTSPRPTITAPVLAARPLLANRKQSVPGQSTSGSELESNPRLSGLSLPPDLDRDSLARSHGHIRGPDTGTPELHSAGVVHMKSDDPGSSRVSTDSKELASRPFPQYN